MWTSRQRGLRLGAYRMRSWTTLYKAVPRVGAGHRGGRGEEGVVRRVALRHEPPEAPSHDPTPSPSPSPCLRIAGR